MQKVEFGLWPNLVKRNVGTDATICKLFIDI